jgi:predicted nucleotidyltransferase
MPDESFQTPLEHAVDLLTRHGVEFIIIGGQAEVLMGGGRTTFDVDVCYRRTADNLGRLAAALQELNPSLRGAPRDLPFRIDAQSLALGSNFTFETRFGGFDLLADVEPIGGYDQLIKSAEEYEYGPWRVKVIALEDLIRIKQHINRPKDRDSLYQLLAVQRVRERDGKR